MRIHLLNYNNNQSKYKLSFLLDKSRGHFIRSCYVCGLQSISVSFPILPAAERLCLLRFYHMTDPKTSYSYTQKVGCVTESKIQLVISFDRGTNLFVYSIFRFMYSNTLARKVDLKGIR